MNEPNMFDAPPTESNDLVLLITTEQKAMVMNELKKLFAFHAKRMSDEERGMFASELCSGKLPYKAILAGIRELQKSKDATINKNVVTYWAIEDACQKHAAESFQPAPCDSCHGSGLVPMLRGEGQFKGYESSFACICENGDRRAKADRIPKWTGQPFQDMVDHRGGTKIAVRFFHDDAARARPQL